MVSKWIAVFIASAIAVGCAGWTSSDAEEREGETKPPPVRKCSELPSDECETDIRCMRVLGNPINETKLCMDEESFVACMEKSTCPETVRYARGPSDDLWKFPDGCIPRDWIEQDIQHDVDVYCADIPPPKECSKLSGSACKDGCTAIEGAPVNESDWCLGANKVLACVDTGACPNKPRFARSPLGELWLFHLGCVPDGWKIETPDGPVSLFCPGDSKDPCLRLSTDACAASDACSLARVLYANADKECVVLGSPVLWCSAKYAVCMPEWQCALAPAGDVVYFANGCIPPSLTRVPCEQKN